MTKEIPTSIFPSNTDLVTRPKDAAGPDDTVALSSTTGLATSLRTGELTKQSSIPFFLCRFCSDVYRTCRRSHPCSCTFKNCKHDFMDSKDWKRHENFQHFHLEKWRCEVGKIQHCGEVYHCKEKFEEHLRERHLANNDIIQAKLTSCRMGRNCQVRFWCGFCKMVIPLKLKGLEAWIERYNHIENHFLGKNGFPPQGIEARVDLQDAKAESN